MHTDGDYNNPIMAPRQTQSSHHHQVINLNFRIFDTITSNAFLLKLRDKYDLSGLYLIYRKSYCIVICHVKNSRYIRCCMQEIWIKDSLKAKISLVGQQRQVRPWGLAL